MNIANYLAVEKSGRRDQGVIRCGIQQQWPDTDCLDLTRRAGNLAGAAAVAPPGINHWIGDIHFLIPVQFYRLVGVVRQ